MHKGLGAVIGAGLLLCAGGAAAAWATWKPVMPDIAVTLKPDDGRAPGLMLIYDERGGDPLQRVHDPRLASCSTINLRCESAHARYEFRTEPVRRQSIQIRRFQSDGNPILGGVSWTGPSYPRKVELTCDLASRDPRRACAITRVTP